MFDAWMVAGVVVGAFLGGKYGISSLEFYLGLLALMLIRVLYDRFV